MRLRSRLRHERYHKRGPVPAALSPRGNCYGAHLEFAALRPAANLRTAAGPIRSPLISRVPAAARHSSRHPEQARGQSAGSGCGAPLTCGPIGAMSVWDESLAQTPHRAGVCFPRPVLPLRPRGGPGAVPSCVSTDGLVAPHPARLDAPMPAISRRVKGRLASASMCFIQSWRQ